MIASHAQNGASPRPLEVLGIDADEERVYRFLLTSGMATLQEVTRGLGLSARKTQRLLDVLEAKGLATRSPERPRRYIASSPDIAVEALASQRQADLERARSAIHELKEQAASANSPHASEQIVELITSRNAVGRVFTQMQEMVQNELVCLERAPVLFSSLLDETDASQRQALAKGVRLRTIADAEFLALPGAVNWIRHDMAMGEEVRIFPTLPFKMVVVDRRIGLIPLTLHEPDGPSLLVRSSALLDALCALFETLWERATPITFTSAGILKNGEPTSRVPEGAGQLIPLLAAGLNDKAIAYELGISSATLNRRVAELMKGLATRTRFQAGWLAALNAFPERLAEHEQDKRKSRKG